MCIWSRNLILGHKLIDFLPPASPTQLLVWWTNTAFTEEDEESFLIILSSVYIVNVSPWSLYNGIILRSNHAFFTWLYHRWPWLKDCFNVWSALGKKVFLASTMCLFLMCTSAFASWSMPSSSFSSRLWQVQVLIIYCRMTFNLSRWPRARGHRWGARVMDAIIDNAGTNSHRRSLTVPLSGCMKQMKEHDVFSRMRGKYASFQQLQSFSSISLITLHPQET